MKAMNWTVERDRYAVLRRLRGFAGCLLTVIPLPISAATVSLCISVDYSDPESGSGCPCCPSGDWVHVEINDVAPGEVEMVISANNLMNDEHVMNLYLNLDPELTVGNLRFTNSSTSGVFTVPSIELGVNAYKAGNDGYYDVYFSFDRAIANGFGHGDILSYTVTLEGGSLKAEDFLFWSEPSGDPDASGPFLAASHVLSTGEDGETSAWVAAVPEPAILLLFSIGVFALLRPRRV